MGGRIREAITAAFDARPVPLFSCEGEREKALQARPITARDGDMTSSVLSSDWLRCFPASFD